MELYLILICSVSGYLLGSFSIARFVTRIIAPEKDLDSVDLSVKKTNSTFQLRTVGATTASMILGPKIGGLIGILDILKGAIPTLVVRLIFPDQPYFLFVGLTIVMGHVWPIYYRFRGGGGLSPVLGALLVTDPLGILVCVLLAFIVGMFLLKEIGFTVMGGPMLFIFWIAFRSGNWIYILFSILLNLIIVIAVIPDRLKARKDGKPDFDSMDAIPMGQMMKKMMEKMGIRTDKED
jgi:glycerol-3-phosphate acyltransferase PlsY